LQRLALSVRNPTAVNPQQRFTRSRPCPICGGWDSNKRGQGARCYGFLSDDGEWGHCTREEYAGGLARKAGSETYPHRLRGQCRCGVMHGPAPQPSSASRPADGPIEAEYIYRDAGGALVHRVTRHEGKGFRQWHREGDTWRKGLAGLQPLLYHLPELYAADPSEPVYLVEGEKDADRARSLGLVATCNSMGAGKWRDEYTAALRDRHVCIIPDNDREGQRHAESVASSLQGAAATVRVVSLPGVSAKGADLSDWLDTGHACAELVELATSAPLWQPTASEAPARAGKKGKGPSQATLLVEIGTKADLFHTPDREPYAAVLQNGHTETWKVRSSGFREHLTHQYFLLHGSAPGSQGMEDALRTIEAHALFAGGGERPVFVRLGQQDERTYLDLGNESWQVVEVDGDGWHVQEGAPVHFRRTGQTAALPAPEHGGSIEQLRPFLNLPDEESWILVKTCLLSMFWPEGPYPVLAFTGEQGTAKSTNARVLRSLIDPSTAPLRSPPKDERDLAIAASRQRVVAIDNISNIPLWQSDAYCRLSTGGGFSTRKLYTDDEEQVFPYTRPLILTGIPDYATANDLLDRAVPIACPRIADEARQDEKVFYSALEAVRPQILGAVLDAVSTALQRYESTHPDHLPRMADFARLACAAAPALGFTEGQFLDAYAGARHSAATASLESSYVALAVQELSTTTGASDWSGTAAELLQRLSAEDGPAKRLEIDTSRKGWPDTPQKLSNELRRIAPALHQAGVVVEFTRVGRKCTRTISIISEATG